jgi:hypothetical protein
VLKKILRFVGECMVVLAIVFAFAFRLAIGIAGLAIYFAVVVTQSIPRLFGLGVACVAATGLWIAYRLIGKHEEPDHDDYAY